MGRLGPEAADKADKALDYFGIAGFDGAFVAWQAEPERSMGALPTEAMDAIAEGITGRVPVSTFIAAGCGKPAR